MQRFFDLLDCLEYNVLFVNRKNQFIKYYTEEKKTLILPSPAFQIFEFKLCRLGKPLVRQEFWIEKIGQSFEAIYQGKSINDNRPWWKVILVDHYT